MSRPRPPAQIAAGAPGATTAGFDEQLFGSAQPLQMQAWRAVEAQHRVATMRLVDTLDDQALLEQILEDSKPPLPRGALGKHFLLSTPFRYRSPHASRFRPANAPGIWYGAASLRTACAETAWWRWRFLMDSSGLREAELLTEHTIFAAEVAGRGVDLMAPPWLQSRELLTQSSDYTMTHRLAAAARRHALQMLRYESARDPDGACCAVLDAAALQSLDLKSQQTWHCRTTRSAVRMIHGSSGYEWTFDS